MAEQKQEKEKKNSSMFKIIGIVVGVGTIIAIGLNIGQAVISVIYKSSFLGITAGDWLEFWGAYVGGIATLGGVSLTLWKGDKDKKEKEKKEKPIIVPLRTEYPYLIDSNGHVVPDKYFLENVVLNKLENKQQFISIPINVVNLGKEHALNLQVSLEQIDYSMIPDMVEKFGFINKETFEQFTQSIGNNKLLVDNEAVRISQGNESNTVYLHQMLYILFHHIITSIYDVSLKISETIPIASINNPLTCMIGLLSNIERFPICKIKFEFTDVYDKPDHNKYLVYAGFSIDKIKENEYQNNDIVKKVNLILTFKNINEDKDNTN